jgi:multiple sugar transport system ATP-binding protein
MASITLRHVSNRYPGGALAARDLTLEIAEGELLVLLGPSGSGKSTVLRLIAGLEAPTEGQVLIDGRDVTGVPPQDRDLAMVFQSYALYPHMTVRRNLEFSLRVRRVPDMAERVVRAAEILGIEALLDRRPAQLSGGQRQRVALGRAIVREPKAFLLDEPLSNLDPLLRVSARAELALLHRRLGTTMVYVTHDQEEAMTLGTRIAVMREGRIEQIDAPLDVFRRPANVFVAGFVGSPAMNFFSPGDGVALRVAERAVLGVRAHDIELTDVGAGDGRGRIEVVEPLGASTVLHLQVDGRSGGLVRVVVPAEHAPNIGDFVGFRLRPDRIHVFDAETSQRRA